VICTIVVLAPGDDDDDDDGTCYTRSRFLCGVCEMRCNLLPVICCGLYVCPCVCPSVSVGETSYTRPMRSLADDDDEGVSSVTVLQTVGHFIFR